MAVSRLIMERNPGSEELWRNRLNQKTSIFVVTVEKSTIRIAEATSTTKIAIVVFVTRSTMNMMRNLGSLFAGMSKNMAT